MELSLSDQRVVDLAKAGQAQSIETLKKTFRQPVFARDPHYFAVHHEMLFLRDSYKSGPETRREVISIPDFAGKGSWSGSKFVDTAYGPPEVVVRRLQSYTSLISKLSALAFAKIDDIEGELAVYDGKSAREADQLRKRLSELTVGKRPVWENWILSMSPHQYGQIDQVVKLWLDEPIDWSERHLFNHGWDDILYSENSARQYFDQIPPMHRAYLGVEWGSFVYKSSGKPVRLYVLKESISTANKRGKLLGAKFRFESF